MKKLSYIILSSVAVLAPVVHASAQEGGLNRQIEVVREYIPDVESARKLDFSPRMIDTVSLRPDTRYSITPTPWKGSFDIRPINPIGISAVPLRPERPFYLRLGAGLPLQTLGDIYITATTANDIALGVYGNHYGRWANIENDLGDKEKATSTRNLAGAYFEKRFARRTLSINLRDDYRAYRDYAGYAIDDTRRVTASGRRFCFNDLSVGVLYGDAFRDLSRFNYRLGASAATFSAGGNAGQDDFEAFFDSGFRLYEGDFTVGAGFRLADGRGQLADYSDWRITVSPKYAFQARSLKVALGLDFIYNNNLGDGTFYMFPEIRLLYDAFHGLIPYVHVYGSLEDGSLKALSYSNPYVNSGYLANPSRYGAKAGIYGSATEVFSYDLYAAADLWRDYNYFTYLARFTDDLNEYKSDIYGYTNRNVSVFAFGGSFSALLARGLTVDAGVKVNLYSQNEDKDGEPYYGMLNHPLDNPVKLNGESVSRRGLGIPAFELSANIKYNYRERFFVSLGLEAIGKREISGALAAALSPSTGFNEELTLYNDTLAASFNLKFEAEYRINERFNVFLAGDNLLNQRIYYFSHYPELGVNVLLGVKIAF